MSGIISITQYYADLDAAVAAEREACAKMAASEALERRRLGIDEQAYPLERIADAIRARGDKAASEAPTNRDRENQLIGDAYDRAEVERLRAMLKEEARRCVAVKRDRLGLEAALREIARAHDSNKLALDARKALEKWGRK